MKAKLVEEIPSIINPIWEDAEKCHDWRNHIPLHIKEIWYTFSSVQKLALYLWTSDLADKEEWE